MSDRPPLYIHPNLPLSALPNRALEEISRLVDVQGVLTNAFMTLGELLGYNPDDCRTISARAGRVAEFNYSPTHMLLHDFSTRRHGTVVLLQRALQAMNHRASDVIPTYLNSMRSSRGRPGSGVQDTEPSGCQCPDCQWRYQPLPISPTSPYVNPTWPQPPWPPDRSGGPRGPASPTSFGPTNIPKPKLPPSPSADGPTSGNSRNGHPTDPRPSFGPQPPHQLNENNVRFIPPESLPSDPRPQQSPIPSQNIRQFEANGQDNGYYQNRGLPNTDEQMRETPREPPIGRSTRCIPNEGQDHLGQQGTGREQGPQNGPSLPARPETSCYCDRCRLMSDIDETPVKTTIFSLPRSECQLPSNTNKVQRCDGDMSNSNNIGVNDERASERVRTCAAHNMQQDNSRVVIGQGNGSCGHSDCQDCALAASRGRPSSWPPADQSEVSSTGLNTSSSDGSISRSRRNLQSDPTSGEIQEIYIRSSFNCSGGTSARVVPSGEMAGNYQNGEVNTDDLMGQMHNMNLRNEAGSGETTTSNNVSNEPNGSNNYPNAQNRRNDLGATARPAPRQTSNRERGDGNRDFVFVTFSWNPNSDDRSHLQEIIQLCRMLKDAGIRVKIDMDPETFEALRLNKQDWLDRMAREAKYVIVCLSPAYYRDTLEPSDTMQPRPDTVQLNARYIFDLLRAEYHGNGARNYRFIPVLFTNSGATHDHIPACMRSTLVYSFPESARLIIRTIRDGEGLEEEEYIVPYPH